jgi:hypothetical protein
MKYVCKLSSVRVACRGRTSVIKIYTVGFVAYVVCDLVSFLKSPRAYEFCEENIKAPRTYGIKDPANAEMFLRKCITF